MTVPVPEEAPATTVKVEPVTEPPKKKTTLYTAWPVASFKFGDVEITDEGVELSAEDAKTAVEAANKSGVSLVTKQEVSE